MMSSRCFLSNSLLACAESGDEPSEDWLSDKDPDGEVSLLGASLGKQQGRLQIADKTSILKNHRISSTNVFTLVLSYMFTKVKTT